MINRIKSILCNIVEVREEYLLINVYNISNYINYTLKYNEE